MNSQAWPQVVYQCMMAQWPQFAASVVNEAMALMQAGNPQPGGPMMQHAHAVTRREHHAALREASAIFLETLKIPDLPPNSTKYMIALNWRMSSSITMNCSTSKLNMLLPFLNSILRMNL